MKRSEFVEEITGNLVSYSTAQEIAMAAERLGQKWEPEEPELPGDLKVERSGPGVMIYRDGGWRWVDLSRVDCQYPMGEDEIQCLEAIVEAANRLPELEDLAQEFYRFLIDHEAAFPYQVPGYFDLLAHARDLGIFSKESEHANR